MKAIYTTWAREELAKARAAQDHDVPARREELARNSAASYLADRIAMEGGNAFATAFDIANAAARLIMIAAAEQQHRNAVHFFGTFRDEQTGDIIAEYAGVARGPDEGVLAYKAVTLFIAQHGHRYIIKSSTPMWVDPAAVARKAEQAKRNASDAVTCTLREYVLAAAAHERAKAELVKALFPAGVTLDDSDKLTMLDVALNTIMCQTSDPRDVDADKVAHLMAIVA